MKTSRIFLTVAVTVLLIAACAPSVPAATPTPYPSQTPYPTSTLYPTIAPTPTATPVPDPLLNENEILAVITGRGWEANGWSCPDPYPCLVYDNPGLQIMIVIYIKDLTVAFNVRPAANVNTQNTELESIVTALFGTDVANWCMDNLKTARTWTSGTINSSSAVDGHWLRIDINDNGDGTVYYGVQVFPVQ